MNMEWYWWVLIALVVVSGAAIKLKVLGMILERRKQREDRMALDE
jgi:NADH:ubiquinone oxidoreductase subunit 3 (subunit A)